LNPSQHQTPQAEQVAEKVLRVIPSEARDLLFYSASKKQQIPRANPALRNDKVRVFPQPAKPVGLGLARTKSPRLKPVLLKPTQHPQLPSSVFISVYQVLSVSISVHLWIRL